MIRVAEAVLEGHPDKFCDLIADRIIEEAYRFDEEAYGQIEVAVWSDRIWLSGATATRAPFTTPVRDLVVEVGEKIGYGADNGIDMAKYELDDTICLLEADPREWTHSVNDQSVCIGWAGYDEGTRFLPPEQFLVHSLRAALVRGTKAGLLAGEGPDGKLLVRLREHAGGWELEHVLATLQQRQETTLLDLTCAVITTLEQAYQQVCARDRRWTRSWADVEVLVNPNGPLLNGGSDGDNGQTGRKLVMDFYGPRIPIGGGALSGKDLTHIDRAGAYAARRAAIEAVRSGATTCQVTLVYAPNRDQPLDVCYEMTGRGRRWSLEDFGHTVIRPLTAGVGQVGRLGSGIHFFDESLPWNA